MLRNALNPENIRKDHKYQALISESGSQSRGSIGECNNERDHCQTDHTVCHYIQPEQMHDLWKQHSNATPSLG